MTLRCAAAPRVLPQWLLALALVVSCPSYADVSITIAPASEMASGQNLVLPALEDQPLQNETGYLAPAMLDAINQAITAASFTAEPGTTLALYNVEGWERIILVGMGKEAIRGTTLRAFGGSAAQILTGEESASILWTSLPSDVDTPAAQIALGARLGGYTFDKYLNPDEDDQIPDLNITVFSGNAQVAERDYQQQWAGLAQATQLARDLVSEPANMLYPESFVARTRSAFKGIDNIDIDVLDVDDMKKLNMGALLGVGMGSARPPRVLVINYSGADKKSAPVVLAGKGVTFDTGGISLKSPSNMWKMKYDMSGAATVTGTVMALALREAPVNVVAISALVENMPGDQAQRPGDVRETMCGKTIEVINTDAEGRLILSDVVCYAQQTYQPRLLIDVATLTGSAVRALGNSYAALFTRNDELATQVIAAGQASGEEVWRLPLHSDYALGIKSTIADVRNVSTSRNAGASTAAHVIGAFIEEDTPWVHLDIAGMAWREEATPTVPMGASGYGILLLNRFIQDYYE